MLIKMDSFSLAKDSRSPQPRRRRKTRKPSHKPNMSPHGAQQDSVGGFVSGAQVAASNQTLNFLLGNRRQPSWMTAQQPQASSGPRRNPAPMPSDHQGGHGQPGNLPSRSQRPSSSNNNSDVARVTPGSVTTSTARQADGSQGKPAALPELSHKTLDCAAALPSPTPTDQPSPPTGTSNQSHHQTRESEIQSPELDHNRSVSCSTNTAAPSGGAPTHDQPAKACPQVISELNSGIASADLGRQALSTTDNHSASRFALSEPGERPSLFATPPSLQGGPSNPDPVTQDIDPQAAPGSGCLRFPEPQPGQTETSPRVVRLINPPVPGTGTSSSPQPAPSSHSITSRPSIQGHDERRHTADHAVAGNHLEESFRPRVMSESLEKYIRHCGGFANLPADGTTSPRYQLLRDAINARDYFFIVLHQILCMWSVDREAAYHLLGLAPSVAESALNVVQNTLRRNDNMAQHQILFFANFPITAASGLWGSEFYRNHTRDVSVFLNNLHEQWNRILIPSMRPQQGRGYPILADELRFQLKLRSSVLESIFFTVTRRHIGVPDGAIADEMHALFQQDARNDHFRLPEEEQRILRHELISRYQQLVIQSFQQQLQSPAGSQRPPPPSAMPRSTFIQRQQTVDQPRGHSASFSAAQTMAPSMNTNSPSPGFDMCHAPNSQHHPASSSNNAHIPPQLMLRSHNAMSLNGGTHLPMQQGSTRMPQMVGHLNQPLTPAGSPHYANVQLPHGARVPQHPGQASPVLQAPLGGLSVSMPTVTSPIRAIATQSSPGQAHGTLRPVRPHGGDLQHSHPLQPRPVQLQGFQQPSNTGHMRQAQAIAQTQATNMVSPQIHHARQFLRNVALQMFSPNMPGIPSTQSPRPPVAQQRKASRDASERLRGNLFRQPHMHVSLDQMPHTAWEPKALAIALHQVDMRSPRRVPQDLPRANSLATSERYYQSIKSLAVGPVATPAAQALHRLVFVVPDENFDKLCPSRFSAGDRVPMSEYFNGSLRYRLRLCELPANLMEPAKVPESTWVVAQTCWPEHISIMVNGQVMKIRRKQHNGQHQPVELTPYLYRGTNDISVAITPHPRSQRPNMIYFTAVEVVETLSHETVLHMVLQQGIISAESTKKAIQNRLKPLPVDGDDEIAVVDNDLSVDLADPFSATIFKIPARGATCTHMECFDLVNWLQTRPAKPRCTVHGSGDDCSTCSRGRNAGPEPSLVDKWKCPLCDGDARPYSLRTDNFMAEVRAKLEMDGKLHTKTIYVAANGTWRPKVEEEVDDEDDEDMEADGPPPAKRAKTRPSAPEVASTVEVIELD